MLLLILCKAFRKPKNVSGIGTKVVINHTNAVIHHTNAGIPTQWGGGVHQPSNQTHKTKLENGHQTPLSCQLTMIAQSEIVPSII